MNKGRANAAERTFFCGNFGAALHKASRSRWAAKECSVSAPRFHAAFSWQTGRLLARQLFDPAPALGKGKGFSEGELKPAREGARVPRFLAEMTLSFLKFRWPPTATAPRRFVRIFNLAAIQICGSSVAVQQALKIPSKAQIILFGQLGSLCTRLIIPLKPAFLGIVCVFFGYSLNPFKWCRWGDSNPHTLADNGF